MFDSNLLSLLQLTDPTLPIGGYAHSFGLETYVQNGTVKGYQSAEEFIRGMLMLSLQYTDAAFVSLAYDAAEENNLIKALRLDQECHAIKLPLEVRQASVKLGMRLIKIFESLCSASIANTFAAYVHAQKAFGHYCIAFGLYAFALEIPKQAALTGLYYNAAVGMVTNSVKLIPLGQKQGQELLFSLRPLIMQLVQSSMVPDEMMIGFCCPAFDIRCMQHEQLYSRLYMS